MSLVEPKHSVIPIAMDPVRVNWIMVGAFGLSRGSNDGQQPFLKFQAHRHGDEIAKVDLAVAQELTIEAARIMINSPFHPDYRIDAETGEFIPLEDSLEEDVEEQYYSLRSAIKDAKDDLEDMPSPTDIAVSVVRSDASWVPNSDFHTRVKGLQERDPDYAPEKYVSNLVRYIIMGQEHRVPEIDAMLKYAALCFKQGSVEFDRYIQPHLPSIVEAHVASESDPIAAQVAYDLQTERPDLAKASIERP